MKIKICGLMTLKDIDYVNQAEPDYVGFIFAKESRRRISINQAKEMKNHLNKNIKSVGVFINPDISEISECIENRITDLIQLHGDEDNQFIDEIKKLADIEIIKAIKADENIKENSSKTNADYILIDNIKPGCGKVFDWALIPKLNKKIFLAGGLNSENIIHAIQIVNPYCVDINSGVETDGKKDKNKIAEIVKKIKGNKND